MIPNLACFGTVRCKRRVVRLTKKSLNPYFLTHIGFRNNIPLIKELRQEILSHFKRHREYPLIEGNSLRG